jgi:hypothetical protein
MQRVSPFIVLGYPQVHLFGHFYQREISAEKHITTPLAVEVSRDRQRKRGAFTLEDAEVAIVGRLEDDACLDLDAGGGRSHGRGGTSLDASFLWSLKQGRPGEAGKGKKRGGVTRERVGTMEGEVTLI